MTNKEIYDHLYDLELLLDKADDKAIETMRGMVDDEDALFYDDVRNVKRELETARQRIYRLRKSLLTETTREKGNGYE